MKPSLTTVTILLFLFMTTSCSQSNAEDEKKSVETMNAVSKTEPVSHVEVKESKQQHDDVVDTSSITNLLTMRLGGRVDVAPPVAMPVKGVYQTRFGDQYGYLIENGRYLFIGDLIDLETAKNFTEIARRDISVKKLAAFADEDMIIYPTKGETKETITIFTDTSCPYCKRLHEESQHLIDAGIQVQYLPFPRGSKNGPGYKTLQQVWCAEDRGHAMHIAKETEIGELDNDGSCVQASVVDKGFIIGNEIGVTGTPAIITSSGEKIDGYVPYARLIPMLLK